MMTQLLRVSFALGALALLASPGVSPRVTTQQLGGASRFLTALSTDKPIYRAGDNVLVRGVLLDAKTHAPSAGDQASIEIKGPKGDTLSSAMTSVIDGAFGYSWAV